MKSNKGILTILSNLSQLILQARISPSQRLRQHLDMLQTELHLLRSQLLPSTQIVHFLVEKDSYNVKSKLAAQLKTMSIDQLCIKITFKITDKLSFLTHTAEIWQLYVEEENQLQKDVSRESKAHELLHMIGQIFQHLSLKQFLGQLVRNTQASKKFIIDFQIELAARQKIQTRSLQEMGKASFNFAALDDTRQLCLEFYSNTRIGNLLGFVGKKSPYTISGKQDKRVKGSLEMTRGDSADLKDSDNERKRFFSQERKSILFQVYDSQLDLTILSSESDSWSGGHIVSELNVGETQQFELLIDERGKQEIFLSENQSLFFEWQNAVQTNFS